MNRQETDNEARATKNTKNVWKWIVGIGIVLMGIAFWGGFFNHNESFKESETPSETNAPVLTDSIAKDTIGSVPTDSIMKNIRGTQ